MYVGLYVKFRYCCQIVIKPRFSLQIFEKPSNIKFRDNPSDRNRTVPCGAGGRERGRGREIDGERERERERERETEGRTDMAKLTVAFCKFANAPKTLP